MARVQEAKTRSFLGGRLQSFRHAFRGLGRLFHEPNARVHAVATLLVLVLANLLRLAPLEWAAVVFAIVLVLGAEAFNTAIEHLADATMPEHHPLVGTAKDLAAGGVLVAALGAAAVGVIVLGPHLLETYRTLR